MQSRQDWAKTAEGGPVGKRRRCELLGISRQGIYYTHAKKADKLRKFTEEDKEVRMAELDQIHTKMPATGARKMARMLTDKDRPTNRYEAAELMRQMNIKAIYPRPNTSKPNKAHAKFPYLLRNKKIWLPNQAWAIDITYIPFKGGHMYLTAIIDIYSRMIMGWALADSLDNAPVLNCVEEAYERYGIPALQNSDQGSHFTSNAYIALLAENNVTQSMDGKGRWVDNVWIERWFRTLKSEYIHINEFNTPRELRRSVADFINCYNNLRVHESLDYKTPMAVWQGAFVKAA